MHQIKVLLGCICSKSPMMSWTAMSFAKSHSMVNKEVNKEVNKTNNEMTCNRWAGGVMVDDLLKFRFPHWHAFSLVFSRQCSLEWRKGHSSKNSTSAWQIPTPKIGRWKSTRLLHSSSCFSYLWPYWLWRTAAHFIPFPVSTFFFVLNVNSLQWPTMQYEKLRLEKYTSI